MVLVLIYGIQIQGSKILVQMTLTTPGCPMHESIAWGVKTALLNIDGRSSSRCATRTSAGASRTSGTDFRDSGKILYAAP